MNRQRALLAAHVSIFFMGIAAVFADASGFEAWRSTAYRVTFGGAVLALLVWRRGGFKLPWSLRVRYLLLGVLLSVHWFAFFRSIELLGVMLGSAMIGVEPIAVALMARIFLGERMHESARWAMGISMIGFVLLGYQGAVLEAGPATADLWRGVAWSLFAFFLFGILVVANRHGARESEGVQTSTLELTTWEMLGAIPVAVIMTSEPLIPADGASWLFALALGLLCTGLAYALYNGSMRVLSAPIVGLLLSLEVVYGMTGGLLLGESMTPLQWVAAVLIANIIVIDLWHYLRRRSRKLPDLANT